MKNLINNMPVFIPNIPTVDTVYPVVVVDSDGVESLSHRVIPDDEISTLMCDDVSLRSLLNAGVDPSRLGNIKTSSYSRVDEIENVRKGLSDIEYPEIEITNETEN